MCIHICICIYIYIFREIRMYMYTCVYIYIYIHIHTQIYMHHVYTGCRGPITNCYHSLPQLPGSKCSVIRMSNACPMDEHFQEITINWVCKNMIASWLYKSLNFTKSLELVCKSIVSGTLGQCSRILMSITWLFPVIDIH